MTGILTNRGSSKLNEANGKTLTSGNGNKNVGETSHSERAMPNSQKQNDVQRKQSKSIIQRFSTTFRKSTSHINNPNTTTDPVPAIPAIPASVSTPAPFSRPQNNNRNTATNKRLSQVPPPISTLAAKSARDAALREMGLLPSLPQKDLSTLEREQDRRLTVVLPAPVTGEGDVSAASLIKKEWEEKENDKREKAFSEKEKERDEEREDRKRMKNFRFGGSSPTTPTNAATTIPNVLEPSTANAATVLTALAEDSTSTSTSNGVLSDPDPARTLEEGESSSEVNLKEVEGQSGSERDEDALARGRPQLETLVEVDTPFSSPVVPASAGFFSPVVVAEPEPEVASSLSSRPQVIPLPPSPLLEASWGEGAESSASSSTFSTETQQCPDFPLGGLGDGDGTDCEPWVLPVLPDPLSTPSIPSLGVSDALDADTPHSPTHGSLKTYEESKKEYKDTQTRKDTLPPPLLIRHMTLDNLLSRERSVSLKEGRSTPVPPESPRSMSVPRPQTPTVVRPGPELELGEAEVVVVIGGSAGQGGVEKREPSSESTSDGVTSQTAPTSPTSPITMTSTSTTFRTPPTSPSANALNFNVGSGASAEVDNNDVHTDSNNNTSTNTNNNPPFTPPHSPTRLSQLPPSPPPSIPLPPIPTPPSSPRSPTFACAYTTEDGSLAPPPARSQSQGRNWSKGKPKSKSRSRSESRDRESVSGSVGHDADGNAVGGDRDRESQLSTPNTPNTPDLELDASSQTEISTLESHSGHEHSIGAGLYLRGRPPVPVGFSVGDKMQMQSNKKIPVIVESPEDTNGSGHGVQGYGGAETETSGLAEGGVEDEKVAVVAVVGGGVVEEVAEEEEDVLGEFGELKTTQEGKIPMSVSAPVTVGMSTRATSATPGVTLTSNNTPTPTADSGIDTNIDPTSTPPRSRATSVNVNSKDKDKSERRKSLSLFGAAVSFSQLKRSVVGSLSSKSLSSKSSGKRGASRESKDGERRGKSPGGFDASHLPPSPSVPEAFRTQQQQSPVELRTGAQTFSDSENQGQGLEDDVGKVTRGRTLTVRGGGNGMPKISSPSTTNSSSSKILTTGIGLRNSTKAQGTQASSGSPLLQPRVAVSPTMHSRGSILFQTNDIEDEESRRVTEVAFLY